MHLHRITHIATSLRDESPGIASSSSRGKLFSGFSVSESLSIGAFVPEFGVLNSSVTTSTEIGIYVSVANLFPHPFSMIFRISQSFELVSKASSFTLN